MSVRPARFFAFALLLASLLVLPLDAGGQTPVVSPPDSTNDLLISSATVTAYDYPGILVFEMLVEGTAGATVPTPAGQMDGAPVMAYVFPTTLPATAVGFDAVDGILALAVTSHPDFDDTPLWDENLDGDNENDGVVYHTHWVVLGPDEQVPGGLSVIEVHSNGEANPLPATAPGMPMYLDSPGFSVGLDGASLRVVVPFDRVDNVTDFSFDAVSCYLQVNTSQDTLPMLGVYAVYSVLSGDLSLPYPVTHDETI